MMSVLQYLMFSAVLLLALGAVICFSFFVIKPLQTRWAMIRARKIVSSGRLPGDWEFRNIYRILATAQSDMEAAKLWRQLDGLIEMSKKDPDYEFMRILGITPPERK
jgi:hypothetical protein